MNGRMQHPREYLFPLNPVNFLKARKRLKEIFTSSTIMAPREQLRSLAHPLDFLRGYSGAADGSGAASGRAAPPGEADGCLGLSGSEELWWDPR